MTALAENHILSKCSLIVPTDPSSFLGIAAQRAAAADDSVRAAMACPATSPAVRKSTSELGYCGGLHAIHGALRLISTQVPDGVAVFGDGQPLPVLLRCAMPRAGDQLFATARPLRLRAGHGTGVEAPLLRGPRVQAGVSRLARVSLKPNFPNPTPPSSTLDPLYPSSKRARNRAAHPYDASELVR